METGTKLSELDLRRWIPALSWLRTYDTSWLRGDLIAGLTLAAYLCKHISKHTSSLALP